MYIKMFNLIKKNPFAGCCWHTNTIMINDLWIRNYAILMVYANRRSTLNWVRPIKCSQKSNNHQTIFTLCLKTSINKQNSNILKYLHASVMRCVTWQTTVQDSRIMWGVIKLQIKWMQCIQIKTNNKHILHHKADKWQ